MSPNSVRETAIISGARVLMEQLHDQGFRLVIATNQPDIARGKVAPSVVDQINRHVSESLSIDAVEVCAHDDSDHCECRKPKPGMLLRAAERDGIALVSSFMVGDRWRDIEAGRRAGCRTVLIGDGYGEKRTVEPDVIVPDLKAAVHWILNCKDRLRTRS